jgi:hypothetical protein
MSNLKHATLATYYQKDALVNLEGLHPYQCFIYGIIRSVLSEKKQSIAVERSQLKEVFIHDELACLTTLTAPRRNHLISFSHEGDFIHISLINKQERVA